MKPLRAALAFLICLSSLAATRGLADVPSSCGWLSEGRLAYADARGIVICSARDVHRIAPALAVRGTAESPDGSRRVPTAGVHRLEWSEDGMRLLYHVESEPLDGRMPATDTFVYDLRTGRTSPVGDDCGIGVSGFCTSYASAGGTSVAILRPARSGPVESTPEVVTLTTPQGSRRAVGALPDEYLVSTPPRGGRVVLYHGTEIGADEWTDGNPVSVFDLAHGERNLGVRTFAGRTWSTLSPDGASLFATADGTGTLAFGTGREAFHNKVLVRCDLAAARCALWHHRAGSVELDPVSSPDGSSVAFVRAPSVDESQIRDAGTLAEPWAEARRLVLVSAGSSANAREVVVPGADRVENPSWIGDRPAFVSRDVLYVIDASGTPKARLQLAPATETGYFYGDDDTNDRYAWHR